MSDIRVTGWNDLIDELYEGSWQPDLARFRSTAVYRGMSNADYALTTALARMGRSAASTLEEHMLRAFRKYAYREEYAGYAVWNWMALGQHHGLSTRLLDWTYSPLVAMHFVTLDTRRFDVDGIIWCVDYHRTNDLLPRPLKEILGEEGSAVFTADMLSRAADSLSAFDKMSDEPFVAFFEPPSLDERIVNQYALFSLVSNACVRLDQWLNDHPEVYRRVIVPAELKLEIRDKLDQANITERVMHPGLDGLCHWLNRYYTPSESGGGADMHEGGELEKPGIEIAP